MSRRHLRIYYVDSSGQLIDRGPICAAVMPKFKMPLTRLPASRYTGPSHIHRRELVAMLMLHESRHQKKPKFHGVILIACPARETPAHRSKRLRPMMVPTNAYLGSFAAIAPTGDVVAGDTMLETLPRTLEQALRRVRDVLMRKPGEKAAGGSDCG
jgi:hypothetical protein